MVDEKNKWSAFSLLLFSLFVLLNGVIRPVQGHGRLIEPPSRSSAWRYGFPTEKDYNDAEAYCGGWSRQHNQNGGKCGVCGDAWDLPQPRAHENGGRYGQGVIVRTYKMNSSVEIGVELTANHNGYFEFRICPQNLAKGPETDECFERYLLRRADASTNDTEGHRYHPGPGSNIVFRSTYQLPDGLTCVQCVLQWRYIAGNNWGTCPNGTGMVGCGPQEQFRGCADIAITPDGMPDPSTPTTTAKPRTRGTVTSRYTRPSTSSSSTESSVSQNFTSTTSATTTTTTTTTESSVNVVPPDLYGGSNPGPYAGIIIALATLLFAILCICGTVFYFYYCHPAVKKFCGDQWRRLRRRVGADGDSSGTSHGGKPPLKLPASVFVQHQPTFVMVAGVTEGSQGLKPPVPPRHLINRPTATNLRQLSLVISEPLDVTINGISVPRDGGSTSSSSIASSGPNSPELEPNVSVA